MYRYGVIRLPADGISSLVGGRVCSVFGLYIIVAAFTVLRHWQLVPFILNDIVWG